MPRPMTTTAALLLSLSAATAKASQFEWLGGSGDFIDAELWLNSQGAPNGVPANGDLAAFRGSSGSSYTVNFNGSNATVANITVDGQNATRDVIFDLDGATFSAFAFGDVALDVSQLATLTVLGGELRASNRAIRVSAGASLILDDGAQLTHNATTSTSLTIERDGRFVMRAGTSFVTSTQIDVGSFGGGLISVDGATIQMTGEDGLFSVTELGTAEFLNGAQITLARDLSVSGLLVIDGSSTFVSFSPGESANNGLVNITATGELRISGGTLRATRIVRAAGADFNVQGGQVSFDEFVGDFAQDGGTLSPGESPGLTHVMGSYSQGADAILEIELGGDPLTAVAGVDFDRLNVDGTAALSGSLDIRTLAGYTAQVGDAFDVVVAATISMEGLSLAGGAAFRPVLIDGESEDILRLIAVDVLGDLNGDAFVGAEDLDVMLANWGNSVTNGDLSSGDVIGDGVIGQSDLAVVLANWGDGTPPDVNIPEPGSVAFLALGGLTLMRRRR